MANTLSLRRRIKTAQNISKTTRAMQMIAASRLKKAQEAAVSSRPYVSKISEICRKMVPRNNDQDAHIYMKSTKKTGKTLYVIISPDKGLCGGLITNLIREYFKYNRDPNSLFITIGKKIEMPVSSTSKNLLASFPFGNVLPSFDQIFPVIKLIEEYYSKKEVDSVKIITTHFTSVFSQSPKIDTLLPVEIKQDSDSEENGKSGEVLYEPNKSELVPAILKRYIEMTVYQHFLESYASEQAARMIAMQNATNNAKDIVSVLQLLYNKARQEKITKEILDISSASVALEQE